MEAMEMMMNDKACVDILTAAWGLSEIATLKGYYARLLGLGLTNCGQFITFP